jgi:hypothetical protein
LRVPSGGREVTPETETFQHARQEMGQVRFVIDDQSLTPGVPGTGCRLLRSWRYGFGSRGGRRQAQDKAGAALRICLIRQCQ